MTLHGVRVMNQVVFSPNIDRKSPADSVMSSLAKIARTVSARPP